MYDQGDICLDSLFEISLGVLSPELVELSAPRSEETSVKLEDNSLL